MNRADWLKTLQPGDSVSLHTDKGMFQSAVQKTGRDKIYIQVLSPDGNFVEHVSWVWKEWGDCPAARIRIEPAPDSMIGGWEAA